MAKSKTSAVPIKYALLVTALALAAPLSTHAADIGLPPLAHGLTAAKTRPATPPLKLTDLDGKAHDLAAYKGKVVLVNFWATWCPPCRREMPSLERLHQKLAGQPFVILAVNLGEDVDTVFSFLGQLEPQPSYAIPLDRDSAAMRQWPVKGLPSTFIVDKQGRTAFSAIGGREFDHPEIEKALRKLLEEK